MKSRRVTAASRVEKVPKEFTVDAEEGGGGGGGGEEEEEEEEELLNELKQLNRTTSSQSNSNSLKFL
ncbi:hypothetical protein JOB18_016150 [Solea senegalensis]|uniref:Uncharacterized protein n=1 Tax=Solea senegalensis TaxID=28829 RepID=A0AAV6PFH8_SOLSE|nr:hypothetical protein JOB18_016150 [Solea senegalensis]